jgi:hypothetical protein
MLKKVLAFLVQLQKVNERDCDDIISEFSGYLDTIPVVGSDKFCNFNPVCTRVDIFYSEQLKSFPKLFSLIKMLLVLSHGQASVERGFSVNKEVEVENLMKQSVVAQRVVCEAVKSAGGVSEIKLVNELMTSCSLARQRYTAHLEKAKELKKSEEQKQKRKAVLDEIDEIKAK